MNDFVFRTIEYQCPRCKNSRILFIPKIMHVVDAGGFQEYYDIHDCDAETRAGILYVDEHFKVRSITVIEQQNTVDNNNFSNTFANIPVPERPLKYRDWEIKQRYFKRKNIKQIQIKDRLRSVNFILGEKCNNTFKAVNAVSKDNFIEVQIICDASIDDITTSEKWAKLLANIIEESVIVDPDFFVFLGSFLDENVNRYSESLGLQLQMLIGAPYLIVERKDYDENIKPVVPETELQKTIISVMSDLKLSSLIYLFVKTSVAMGKSLIFSDFVEEMATLVEEKLVTIKALEFTSPV